MIPPETHVVKDDFFAYYERLFRQYIYRDQYLQDDEVITNKVYIPYSVHISDWIEGRVRPFDTRLDHAAAFSPSIVETSDLKKLKFPKLYMDEEKSKENYDIAQALFGEYLDVIQGEPFYNASFTEVTGHGTSLVDLWCELRGLETVFFDLVDEPEFTKDAMQFLMEGTIEYLHQGIELGVWTLNNNGFVRDSTTPCGTCALAYTHELPQKDFDSKVRLKDLWGYSMSQEFHPISPNMLEEFVLPYQAKIADLFGLNAYGCCEKNDHKWDIITEYIPRLRALSVSPYSSLSLAVNKLEDRYVLAWKPNPSDMIIAFDPDRIKREMSNAMEIAKDAHLVIICREIDTVMNEPERLTKWIDITMELAQKY
ncbi:MAG: hypothetical protein ACOYJC_10650 [Christensenellales bacterium]|jgi:hypothetical protein